MTEGPSAGAAPVLIAGPTASGKSALAIELARRLGGVVVNADSQQVYAEWRVLTARPSPEEEAAVPHRLYGHVGVTESYSVGRWLGEVRTVLSEVGVLSPAPLPGRPAPRPLPTDTPAGAPGRPGPPGAGAAGIAGRRPIIVGGTGLYFTALTEGLAPIPDIPAELRAAGEAELARIGLGAFAERLAARDPETAAALDMANPRRVLRAWEVLEGTGIGLAAWKARTPPPLLDSGECVRIALMPSRATVYARCEARFDAMLTEGALDEVRRVLSLGIPREAPALKAVGAAELAACLAGELSLDEAADRAKAETRRYAKRQLTWIRNRMADWAALGTPDPEAALALTIRRDRLPR